MFSDPYFYFIITYMGTSWLRLRFYITINSGSTSPTFRRTDDFPQSSVIDPIHNCYMRTSTKPGFTNCEHGYISKTVVL